mmetsp:Transcript_4944/g.10447  ORF Transcript_4944/g.10447 Transcript_4944/m.10447 type:complete len:309 (+) Transcript_4944:69-995(+)
MSVYFGNRPIVPDKISSGTAVSSPGPTALPSNPSPPPSSSAPGPLATDTTPPAESSEDVDPSQMGSSLRPPAIIPPFSACRAATAWKTWVCPPISSPTSAQPSWRIADPRDRLKKSPWRIESAPGLPPSLPPVPPPPPSASSSDSRTGGSAGLPTVCAWRRPPAGPSRVAGPRSEGASSSSSSLASNLATRSLLLTALLMSMSLLWDFHISETKPSHLNFNRFSSPKSSPFFSLLPSIPRNIRVMSSVPVPVSSVCFVSCILYSCRAYTCSSSVPLATRRITSTSFSCPMRKALSWACASLVGFQQTS